MGEIDRQAETCKDLSSYLFSVCMRKIIVEQSDSEQSSAEKEEIIVEQSDSEQSSAEKEEKEREEEAEEEREGESNNTQFDKIEKNCWVVVEYQNKRIVRHYIGKVLSVNGEEINVHFLKR
ncbi:hypothetical protein QE152_g40086 [Popillia japonica]|uniref:Uncharacterized protein n=1 Tax=Popillia japonica TaxID=7064 RepID=A0AAW1HS46_POPJA